MTGINSKSSDKVSNILFRFLSCKLLDAENNCSEGTDVAGALIGEYTILSVMLSPPCVWIPHLVV